MEKTDIDFDFSLVISILDVFMLLHRCEKRERERERERERNSQGLVQNRQVCLQCSIEKKLNKTAPFFFFFTFVLRRPWIIEWQA